MEVHADGNAGADVRFHSFWVQAQECSTNDPTYHGQLTIGGHFDYGILNATHVGNGSVFDVRVPLPDIDPCTPQTLLPNAASCPYIASRRTHGASESGPAGSADPNAALPGDLRYDFTWYGHNTDPDLAGQSGLQLGVSDGVREQDWGPIDPNNPHGSVLFYGPGHDHGWGGIDIFDFNAPNPGAFPADDPARTNPDGTYSWTGFVDVHGRVQSIASCQDQPIGDSCIPALLANVRPGEAQFSNDVSKLPPDNYDVTDANGVSLIGYPN
jgi:hypothetical protein